MVPTNTLDTADLWIRQEHARPMLAVSRRKARVWKTPRPTPTPMPTPMPMLVPTPIFFKLRCLCVGPLTRSAATHGSMLTIGGRTCGMVHSLASTTGGHVEVPAMTTTRRPREHALAGLLHMGSVG